MSRAWLIGALALSAVVGAFAQERPAIARRWQAPRTAADRRTPLADDPGILAGGRKLFQERCASCHADDGRGGRGVDLTDARTRAQTDGELFWKVTSGSARRGMPTFSFLSEAQRWQLVIAIRHLEPSH
jgi:mono/diheme cytochrome c family protein